MTGSIVRLLDGQQIGTIAGEDGTDYPFAAHSLLGMTFSSLFLGLAVTFTPSHGPGTQVAMSVRRRPSWNLRAPKQCYRSDGRP
jgi:hypothetical protein